jgi:hypothetical protein
MSLSVASHVGILAMSLREEAAPGEQFDRRTYQRSKKSCSTILKREEIATRLDKRTNTKPFSGLKNHVSLDI